MTSSVRSTTRSPAAAGPRARSCSGWPTRDGRLEGPFNAFLLQPRLGSALQALGSAVRYDTGLDDRCREIAILVVAAHWRSDFEWYAHEAVARSAGLGDAELAAVRDGRHAALAGREAVVARTAAALVARGDLDDAEYREAVGQVGAAGLFELLTLVGYYATLALQLRVFRVPAPDDTAPPCTSLDAVPLDTASLDTVPLDTGPPAPDDM